jgi:outer membrane receptor for ferric coprogen and ferric-rhodotorulic acid
LAGIAQAQNSDSQPTPAAPSSEEETVLPTVTVTATAEPSATTEGTGSYTTEAMSTATKLPLSIRETPQSVTVITRERMDDEGMSNLVDALKATPGITVNKQGAQRVYIYSRGFEVANVMADGQSVPMGYAHSDMTPFPDMAMYDRIEIVRGATGLMQGAGNPSALVNMIRKRPTREFQFSLAGHAGSWDDYRGEVDVSGAFNASGSLRGRFVASYQDTDSFLDIVSQNKSLFYAIGEADLGARTTLTLGVSHQKDNNSAVWRGLPMAPDGGNLHLPRSTYLGYDWEYWDRQNTSYFAELEHRFDNGWKLRFAANHGENELEALGSALEAPNGIYNKMSEYYEYSNGHDSYDLYTSGPFRLFDRKHELVFGAHSNKTRMEMGGLRLGQIAGNIDFDNFDHHSVPRPATDTPISRWQDVKVEQRGAYLTSRLNLADPLKLILGARLNWYEYSDALQGSGYKVNREPVYYAGLVYDLDARHSAYVSYTDIFQPQNAYGFDGKLLEPMLGKNYEVGIKGEYFGGALNASAALFRIDSEKRAQSQADQSGCPFLSSNIACYETSGLIRSQGIDLEIQGALSPNWQMAAGYTYGFSEQLSHMRQYLAM